MFRVRVADHPMMLRATITTTVALDERQVQGLVHPSKCQFVKTQPGKEYVVDVAKPTCPWSAIGLEKRVARRLERGLGSRCLREVDGQPLLCRQKDAREHPFSAQVWNVDGHPFPNEATKAVRELMRRGDEVAKEQLMSLQQVWEREIRLDTAQLDNRVCHWAGERAFFDRMQQRVARRVALITWIDHFFDDGLSGADTFGRSNMLIQDAAEPAVASV